MKNLLSLICLFCVLRVQLAEAVDPEPEQTSAKCESLTNNQKLQRHISLGFDATRGNGESSSVTFGASASKILTEERWQIDLAYSFAEHENKKGGTTSKTRNQALSSAAYFYDISEDLYAAFGLAHRYDQVALVDYRFNLNPALGITAAKSDRVEFRVESGPSYVFEKVNSVTDSYFAPRAAETLQLVLSCTSKITQLAEVLYDVTNSDNYLLNAQIGIEAKIANDLSLSLVLRHSYDNLPAETREKDDLALTTALKVNF
jgi:putative salt-induced outer membrane protein YdiY